MNFIRSAMPAIGALIVGLAIYSFQPGTAAMILGLIVLIILHEFGHWIVARMFGFKTPVFSIGFGKREWSWVIGTFWETEFRFSPILLGGYVSIPELLDETTAAELAKESGDETPMRTFPVYQRMLVAVAGVVMNVLAAFVIFASMFYFIGQPNAEITATKIGALSTEITIAHDAGLKTGDKFVSIDGVNIVTPQELINAIQSNKGNSISIVVERNSQPMTFEVTPNADGKIGFHTAVDQVINYKEMGFGESVVTGATHTGTQIVNMVKGLGMMVGLVEAPTGADTSVHGIVGIVSIGAQAFDQGAFMFLSIVAVISLNLALLNILPIPMLDGGHMMFYTIEAIRGKPVSYEVRQRLSSFFFILLIALMFLGLFNDFANPIKLP